MFSYLETTHMNSQLTCCCRRQLLVHSLKVSLIHIRIVVSILIVAHGKDPSILELGHEIQVLSGDKTIKPDSEFWVYGFLVLSFVDTK